jgi:hypothetical protein
VCTVAVAHRQEDLRARSDDGTSRGPGYGRWAIDVQRVQRERACTVRAIALRRPSITRVIARAKTLTVATARAVAMTLPETTEAPHFEATSFRVRGKIFATRIFDSDGYQRAHGDTVTR